jgi:hypothetical protein
MSKSDRPIDKCFSVEHLDKKPNYIRLSHNKIRKSMIIDDHHKAKLHHNIVTYESNSDRRANEDHDPYYSYNYHPASSEHDRVYYSKGQARYLPLIPVDCTSYNGLMGKVLNDVKNHQIDHMLRIMGSDLTHLILYRKGTKKDVIKFHSNLLYRFRVMQIRTLVSYITRALVPLDFPIDILIIISNLCCDDPMFTNIHDKCVMTIERIYRIYHH